MEKNVHKDKNERFKQMTGRMEKKILSKRYTVDAAVACYLLKMRRYLSTILCVRKGSGERGREREHETRWPQVVRCMLVERGRQVYTHR